MNKFRSIFWPIKHEELSKFIPVSCLMFCILFNQNILKILKDSVLISEISAEVISFAKLYCVTPSAALLVVIYSRMVNSMSFDKIFYYFITIFTGFFLLFAFVIYPNVDFFHLDTAKAAALMNKYPHFRWYIALFGNWSYAIFYTFSELWANVFYVLLFWQIANDITSSKDAKRLYTFFSLFGNSALVFVGVVMILLSSDRFLFSSTVTDLKKSKIMLLQLATIFVFVFSCISSLLVRYIAKHIVTNSLKINKAISNKITKPSFKESLNYIIKSYSLWLILVCTASFGFSMNLAESIWKAKIREIFPSMQEYARFNSWYTLCTGGVIIIMTIIGNQVMSRKGWLTTALISPIIVMATGSLFFISLVFNSEICNLSNNFLLLSPMLLPVIIGTIQNVLSRATKLSLWDTSKQMLYIPLNYEIRTKGKAAVDVLSPKIGKSFSSFIQSAIFTILPSTTYTSIAPFFMIIFIIICIIWMNTINKIDLEYKKADISF